METETEKSVLDLEVVYLEVVDFVPKVFVAGWNTYGKIRVFLNGELQTRAVVADVESGLIYVHHDVHLPKVYVNASGQTVPFPAPDGYPFLVPRSGEVEVHIPSLDKDGKTCYTVVKGTKENVQQV